MEAAYIIGGYVRGDDQLSDVIAEFKNDSWRQMGTLARARGWHGAIALEHQLLVIGGAREWDSR